MNLNDEYVTLKNTGEDAIDMTGWSLKTSETMSSPSQVVLTFLVAQQSRYNRLWRRYRNRTLLVFCGPRLE